MHVDRLLQEMSADKQVDLSFHISSYDRRERGFQRTWYIHGAFLDLLEASIACFCRLFAEELVIGDKLFADKPFAFEASYLDF